MIPNLTFIFDRKGHVEEKGKGVVELKIGSGRKRKYVSTNVWLKPNEWSDGSVVGRKDWHELNSMLQLMKKKAAEIIIRMMDKGNLEVAAIPSMLKEEIAQAQTFIGYAKEMASRRYRKIAPGTREHYELFFRFMDEWRGIVYFSDVTERNVIKMDDILISRGLKEISCGIVTWNRYVE